VFTSGAGLALQAASTSRSSSRAIRVLRGSIFNHEMDEKIRKARNKEKYLFRGFWGFFEVFVVIFFTTKAHRTQRWAGKGIHIRYRALGRIVTYFVPSLQKKSIAAARTLG
jgi:hypothetical protein